MFEFDTKTGEIWLFDEISETGMGGISAGDVKGALNKIGKKPVTVRFNSPGGSLTEGTAIFNLLKSHPKPVTTINDGLAASIANYIFMVGETRLVQSNALSMMHRPWSLAMGDAGEMRKTADLLDKAEGILSQVYSDKMDMKPDRLSELLAAETWWDAEEAVSNGMATGTSVDLAKVEPFKVAAMRFKNAPAQLIKRMAAGAKTPYKPLLSHYERIISRSKA